MRKKIKVVHGVDATGSALAPAELDASLPLSRAQWWRPSDAEGYEGGEEAEGKFKRSLMGEMTLPNNLTPSFTFGKFDLKVRRRHLVLRFRDFVINHSRLISLHSTLWICTLSTLLGSNPPTRTDSRARRSVCIRDLLHIVLDRERTCLLGI